MTRESKYPVYNFFRKNESRWSRSGWGYYADGTAVNLVSLRKEETPSCLCLGGALRFFYAPNRFVSVITKPEVDTPEAFLAAAGRVQEILETREFSKSILYANDVELSYKDLLSVVKAAKV